ncbi:hypothetical protein WBJ53_32010 [Spirosoma sp. SC4-14]|uniref:hypothetical protein n=1 Tax=Spirosoma sp. SC4-14 TaxID=3128900 RepID=UPI0030D478DE
MTTDYWDSQRQGNWNVYSDQQERKTTDRSAEKVSDHLLVTGVSTLPVAKVITFPNRIELVNDIKYVMRKMAMIVVGATLFVAGYRHIHRQAEYVTTQSATSEPNQKTIPDNIKNSVAFRLVKAS